MRRILGTLAVIVSLAAVTAGIAAAVGGGNSITRPRVERSLAAVFANQYSHRADLLGQTGVTPTSLRVTAMCDKHGPNVPDVGPGSDWICLMGWSDPSLPMPPEGYGKFEVSVTSNDCFTAVGPTKLIGFPTITDARGREVTNPVSAFDGCFDPNGDNTPTGHSFPSLIVVTTSVQLLPNRTVNVQVFCGTGAAGCAGEVSFSSGDQQLGTVPYRSAEEHGLALHSPKALPPGAKDLTLTFDAKVGKAPGSPTTVKVQ